jgi:GTPase SAR1 family protein
MTQNKENSANESRQLRIKYDESKATYASQALVQANAEEVIIDFSSGILQDPSGEGSAVMPIHSRIAMTHAGAQRLLGALTQTLQKQQVAPAKKDR